MAALTMLIVMPELLSDIKKKNKCLSYEKFSTTVTRKRARLLLKGVAVWGLTKIKSLSAEEKNYGS